MRGTVLRRFVNPNKLIGSTADDFAGTPWVLWLGYRSTNSLFGEDAVLVSDAGLQLALAQRVEDAHPNSERLMSWEIPSSLTNHGKYRLTIPKDNRTLLTFIYD